MYPPKNWSFILTVQHYERTTKEEVVGIRNVFSIYTSVLCPEKLGKIRIDRID